MFNALMLSRITDMASKERGFSRSVADKIIESVSDEHLAGSRRFDYERSYVVLLGVLRKHRKNDCVAMDPSECFDYIVSIFSEGSLRRFSDYLDADISIMTFHSAKGLEWDTVFIPGVARFDWPGRICSRCESAGMCSRSAYVCRIVDTKNMPAPAVALDDGRLEGRPAELRHTELDFPGARDEPPRVVAAAVGLPACRPLVALGPDELGRLLVEQCVERLLDGLPHQILYVVAQRLLVD